MQRYISLFKLTSFYNKLLSNNDKFIVFINILTYPFSKTSLFRSIHSYKNANCAARP